MTVTISRLYDDYATAAQVVRELESAGINRADISLVASNADNWYSGDRKEARASGRIDRDRDGTDDRAEGAAAGAGIGAAVGGAAGLLAGLGMLAIPGLGPVVAAGWLASLATGAAAGGATGGILGALSQAGIGKDEADVYAEGIRRGGTLVSVRAPEAEKARVQAILDRNAVDISERGAAYRKGGWSRFDPNASAYTADQVRKERDLYRRSAA
jgi:hypothetical protein